MGVSAFALTPIFLSNLYKWHHVILFIYKVISLKALVNDKIINNMARRTIIDHKTGFTNEFATEDDKVIYHTPQDRDWETTL